MDDREAEEFRRIEINSQVERASTMISKCREGIDFYRDQLDECHERLGRIAERLGEPERGA